MPSGAPTDEVARAVEASAWLRAERIGNKPLGGQARPVKISPRHAGTADKQLTRNADGHRLEIPVCDVQSCIGDRSTNGDGARNGLVSGHEVDATPNDCLGRTVLIDQGGFRRVLPPESDVLGPELLSTDDKRSCTTHRVAGIYLVAEPPEMSRSNLDETVISRLLECLAELLDAQVIVEQVERAGLKSGARARR